MSDRLKTAAELMAELQSNSGFRKREVEQTQKRALREEQYVTLWKPYLTILKSCGFDGESVQEIVEKFAPLPPLAIDVLLSAFSELTDARLKESAVRALAAAQQPFDGRKLVSCFERASDEGLRWAILNTIAVTRPHSIDDWLAAVQDTPTGETLRKLSRI
jgi:hypothetical protein